MPEPVLDEDCHYLSNHVCGGPALEVRFLDSVTSAHGDFEIANPTKGDRDRARELTAQLVSAPLGYVDALIIATAERTGISEIATLDFKFLGMASPVSRLQPLEWVLQES